ncbi:copper resistance CopC family protein [Actibacterium sp. 188UL27-1]|uniref:copper resistance CopC family protein n=1 Tax=Actibacterium sp. 188UL27-1 TaxID=2786961 RepID=UPI001956D76C|nr:copper resistance CopC family protein [Actibacterium sp. 188UL27-1]MBM7069913.1 copper resistance protein CopC [Actibacterium sp. 188UL27-1]
MRGRIFAVAGLIAVAGWAFAHSSIETSTPADGAVVAVVPAEIALRFDDEIRLTSVRVERGDQTIALDLSAIDGFSTEYALPFNDMGAGAYRIEWRGLAVDGHAMQGTFSFDVK